jgi:glutaredoxin
MRVEIYTKADCHLCDEAKAVLRSVKKRVPFEWVEVDISTQDDLYRKYRYDIPVIMIDGRMAFRHRVTEAELENRLRQPAGM